MLDRDIGARGATEDLKRMGCLASLLSRFAARPEWIRLIICGASGMDSIDIATLPTIVSYFFAHCDADLV